MRVLDKDLSAMMKPAEPFDWERIAFILEAHMSKCSDSKNRMFCNHVLSVRVDFFTAILGHPPQLKCHVSFSGGFGLLVVGTLPVDSWRTS